jgi:membrane-associated phospholipid phosphatase
MQYRSIVGAALALSSGSLQAQVTLRSSATEFGDAVSDIGYTLGTPLRADGRSWLATAVVGTGFVVLLPIDDDVDRWMVDHQQTALLEAAKPFRTSNEEFSRLPTDARLLPISGALLLAGMITDRRPLREAGYGCASAWLVSNSLRAVTYAGVSRPRPLVAAGDQYEFDVPGGEWNFHSFFSGHTMNAFACVTFVNQRFSLGVAEPLLYGLAAAISVARMADRLHWFSDSYLGTVGGIVLGRTLAHRYERREARRERRSEERGSGSTRRDSWMERVRLSATPRGVALSWAF